MKLFKTTPQPPDGYAILLDNLKQTTAELQNTYANLENVVDPDLIDYYIYQAKAVQMRYKFLLGCVNYSRIRPEGITRLSDVIVDRCVSRFAQRLVIVYTC